jgi:protein arginine N-methyltransferase 7
MIPRIGVESLADLAEFAPFFQAMEGRPAQLQGLALYLLHKGRRQEAMQVALKIWQNAGHDAETELIGRHLLGLEVPSWHFSMVRDDLRNQAYDAALRRAIRPGDRVLDIGSGSGLLAMMAVRAGAGTVFTCEMNPAIADAARDIIAANGFAERIEVLGVHSGSIDAERDLGGRVDLIVAEIVDNSLLGEGVLPTMEEAVRDLLKPGGRVIPARGRVRVALAESSQMKHPPMGEVAGFDLSAFNRLLPQCFSRNTEEPGIELRSLPANLLTFDFGQAERPAEGRGECVLEADGGRVNVILQWIELEMDSEGVYENRPGTGQNSAWPLLLYPLAQPADMARGQQMVVHAWHDRTSIRIWQGR